MLNNVWTMSPSALLQTLLTLMTVASVCWASVSHCPEGFFRNRYTHSCQACSTCPVNQIIRKPCREDSNTLCGPFSEFLEFHQAPRPSLEVGDLPLPDDGDHGIDDDRNSDDNRSTKFHDDVFDSLDDDQAEHHAKRKHHKTHSNKSDKNRQHPHKDDTQQGYDDMEVFPEVQGSTRAGERGVPTGGIRSRGQHEGPSLQDSEEGENQWKVLALALIVVLCVVCIFLIVFVFVVCYMRSRRAHLKQVLYSADKGPSTRNPGGQRTFPSMHYVPVLTHAQGRAGTSGGALAAPPGGMVDSTYLYSEEYDADNSGQTISTTKSSDYVYFKSPHNGNNVYDV